MYRFSSLSTFSVRPPWMVMFLPWLIFARVALSMSKIMWPKSVIPHLLGDHPEDPRPVPEVPKDVRLPELPGVVGRGGANDD